LQKNVAANNILSLAKGDSTALQVMQSARIVICRGKFNALLPPEAFKTINQIQMQQFRQ